MIPLRRKPPFCLSQITAFFTQNTSGRPAIQPLDFPKFSISQPTSHIKVIENIIC